MYHTYRVYIYDTYTLLLSIDINDMVVLFHIVLACMYSFIYTLFLEHDPLLLLWTRLMSQVLKGLSCAGSCERAMIGLDIRSNKA